MIRSNLLSSPQGELLAAEAAELREARLLSYVTAATEAHREFLSRFDVDGAPPTKVDEDSQVHVRSPRINAQETTT